MLNKYLFILIAAITSAEIHAAQISPRLVVNITIEDLTVENIKTYEALFSANGFKKLFTDGVVYENGIYPFNSLDRSSAIATLNTGSSPFYHGIISDQWLDRKTLQPSYSFIDNNNQYTVQKLKATTLSDELKLSTNGHAIVNSVGLQPQEALFTAGHAANNAIWIDATNKKWIVANCFNKNNERWIQTLIEQNTINPQQLSLNESVANMALQIMTTSAMGMDEIPDLLSVSLSANPNILHTTNRKTNKTEAIYLQLDAILSKLITTIEQKLNSKRILFVLTSYQQHNNIENYERFNIPTGTFYINRTANLLNVYLSALYGQGRYVDAYFQNQLYLNRNIIEQKKLSFQDVLSRSKDLLTQTTGVLEVLSLDQLLAYRHNQVQTKIAFNPTNSGDLIIETLPGWKIYNEDNHTTYTSNINASCPIIFYGLDLKHEYIKTIISVDRVAPTIAKSIQIRAPNACMAAPLF